MIDCSSFPPRPRIPCLGLADVEPLLTVRRTRIKICGLRDPEMARAASQAGADAIGLVFHAASPRNVDLREAAAIARVVPAFVTVVGLFVDAPEHVVRAALGETPLGALQFSGSEPPAFCAQFGLPWVKSVPVGEGVDLVEFASRYQGASALLLDAPVAGQHGGTGQTFDWSRVPRGLPVPIVVAGGLNPGNVGAAIAALNPWGVDVSSGVESGRGRKDANLIEQFVRSVRDADARSGG